MANANGNNSAMLTQKQETKPANPFKALMNDKTVKQRFEQILDKRAPQYMSSIVNLVSGDVTLSKCEPMSVIGSCMVAATMDLPIDKNLGYAWVVPYKDGKTQSYKAQFQLGYRGYIQLALRTAQYKHINVLPVHEGELIEFNPLTEEIRLDFSAKLSEKVIGYAAYFELLNGFKKTVYWTREHVEAHKKRYSKAGDYGPWKDDFDAMAQKTVLKAMLSKWGILSIQMQQAFKDDEQTVKPSEDTDSGNIVDIDVEFADMETAE